MRICARRLTHPWALTVVFSATLVLIAASGTSGQIQYSSGQNIAPDFAGWESNPDGSFNMVFGYMNRNYEEKLHIPVGPNNRLDPGGPDQGQPTYFLPRRNRYVFRVRVPSDFGGKELVWTVTAHGKTASAFATLKPDYALDQRVVYLNNSGFTQVGRALRNKAPVVRIDGDLQRVVKVGESLTLTAFASDDGIPAPKAAPLGGIGFKSAMGLRVAWFVFRGAGDKVTFSPEQFKVYADFERDSGNSPWSPGWAPPAIPADGKFPVKVTFGEPGTFVLRVLAHDGGFETAQDVTVTVQPAAANTRVSPKD